MDSTQDLCPVSHQQRRSSRKRNGVHRILNPCRVIATSKSLDCVGGALPDLSAIEIHATHPRLCGKRNELCIGRFRDGATPQTILFGQDDNAPAFGSLVSQGCPLCSIGQFLNLDSRCRKKLSCLTVSKSDS